MNISPQLPSYLHISIDPEVLASFPQTKVAILVVAMSVLSKKNQPKEQQKYLSDLKQFAAQTVVNAKITPENYQTTRVCQSWQAVFNSFGVDENKKSTITNLLKRAAQEGQKIVSGKKADLGAISNFVDFYNCVSISTMTPMGATDITKIASSLDGHAFMNLRFAKSGESFIPLGRDAETVSLTPKSVVYADNEKILTGFWNWRDSRDCCVTAESEKNEAGEWKEEYILLVADQADQDEGASEKTIAERPGDVEDAILTCQRDLGKVGGSWLAMDILSANRPSVTLDLTRIKESEVSVNPEIGASV